MTNINKWGHTDVVVTVLTKIKKNKNVIIAFVEMGRMVVFWHRNASGQCFRSVYCTLLYCTFTHSAFIIGGRKQCAVPAHIAASHLVTITNEPLLRSSCRKRVDDLPSRNQYRNKEPFTGLWWKLNSRLRSGKIYSLPFPLGHNTYCLTSNQNTAGLLLSQLSKIQSKRKYNCLDSCNYSQTCLFLSPRGNYLAEPYLESAPGVFSQLCFFFPRVICLGASRWGKRQHPILCCAESQIVHVLVTDSAK